jgi:hypothetical protein
MAGWSCWPLLSNVHCNRRLSGRSAGGVLAVYSDRVSAGGRCRIAAGRVLGAARATGERCGQRCEQNQQRQRRPKRATAATR